ncbi:hypothetical protein DHEL01_v205141 [Diaporthe helianthi]|uniref:Uncharacterized protein n=1 Tax=Diaporthe helianthi TaxID=158607 RepID=A0A2P5I1X7_DIAHE|nr:hypothetical protein DHEL01_v205141 [Diaporthe helianthi]
MPSGHPMASAALVHKCRKGCQTTRPEGCRARHDGKKKTRRDETRPAPVSAVSDPASVSVPAGATLVP